MKKTDNYLEKAVQQGIISEAQRGAIEALSNAHVKTDTVLDFSRVIYLLGAVLALVATWTFLLKAIEQQDGWALMGSALGYMSLGFWGVDAFYNRKADFAARCLGIFVIALAPAAVFGFILVVFGYQPWSFFDDSQTGLSRSFCMELSAILVAWAMYYRYRYTVFLSPLVFTFGLLILNQTEQVHHWDISTWQTRALLQSVGFAMILTAWGVDIYTCFQRKESFWGYFWGGFMLTVAFFCAPNASLGLFLNCMKSIGLFVLGLLWLRKILAFWGAVGVGYYLTNTFSGVLGLSLLLAGLGGMLILLGWCWERFAVVGVYRVMHYCPQRMRRCFPPQFFAAPV
ncbi:MAG: hypothetical protein Q8R79_02070 [Legionellaceae bacterium]|nr:hypothetical protein [Legionellaceae bacterium]